MASAVESWLTYSTGTALLHRLMEPCTRRGFRIVQVKVERLPGHTDDAARVVLGLEGTDDPAQLASKLFQDDAVIDVEMATTGADDE